MKKTVLFLSWLILIHIHAKSQVTIGSTMIEPVKGALLDLKETSNADGTTATTGGFLLSRVKLVDQTTLQPFIEINDYEWQNNQAKTRVDHIGLIVFNLTENSFFHHGLYVWKGNAWEALSLGNNAILLPAFKLKWQTGLVNLFDVYKNNFNPDFNANANLSYFSSKGEKMKVAFPNPVSNATDFHYLVAGHNPKFSIDDITLDGIMKYSTQGANAPQQEEMYINIILIQKSK